MQIGNLAFLENFYTDVMLFVPPEPGAAIQRAAPEPAIPVPIMLPTAAMPAAAVTAAEIMVPTIAVESKTVSPAVEAFTPPVTVGAASPRPPVAPARLPEAALQAVPAVVPAVAAALPVMPPATPVAPAQLTPFTTLGTNAQGVVLLVRLPPDQFIKLTRNVFLNKLLQALGLVLADVVLVNVESHLPVALTSLRRELAATQIVAFGRNLLDVTVRNTQIYQPVQFPQLGFAYLAAAEIEMVEYDVSLKKRLWPGLQAMFLQPK